MWREGTHQGACGRCTGLWQVQSRLRGRCIRTKPSQVEAITVYTTTNVCKVLHAFAAGQQREEVAYRLALQAGSSVTTMMKQKLML